MQRASVRHTAVDVTGAAIAVERTDRDIVLAIVGPPQLFTLCVKAKD